MEEDQKKKVEQLQVLDQNMQNLTAQKQQFNTQLFETDSALTELNKGREFFKIIGNIMVSSNKEDLEKDLTQRKEILELRIKTLEKQESKYREEIQKIQKDLMDLMKETK